MKDYSPLFSQGIFNTAVEIRPCHVAAPPPAPKSRTVKGRSFLHLKSSMHFEQQSFDFVLRSRSDEVSFPSAHFPTTIKSPSCSTSPSRRTLPLPKPAPLATLPSIPIAINPVSDSAHTSLIPHRTSSPAPSSAIDSVASSMTTRNRKRTSRAASFFSARTHQDDCGESAADASSVYRKRRRQDALHALEGFDRVSPKSSFAPSVLPEEYEDITMLPLSAPPTVPPSLTSRWWPYRSHLSFGSTVANSSAIFSVASKASASASRLRSPTTPCFAVGYADDPTFEALSRDIEPRRASAEGQESIGWGVNFIELEDDSASSSWRWSHVA